MNKRARESVEAVMAGNGRWCLLPGNCRTILPLLPQCSIDVLVTDPPAGIEFMGTEWDSFKASTAHGRSSSQGWEVERGTPFARGTTPCPLGKDRRHGRVVAIRERFVVELTEIFGQSLQLLKPGAHAIVWALPRTSHWTATALENAGFEIRDIITHHFGSGFPKSKNLGGEWSGWGTGLKPASEHWILARKPLSAANVAVNVDQFGTGALNIDGCRIDSPQGDGCWGSSNATVNGGRMFNGSPGMRTYSSAKHPKGRWPANLVLSHSASCKRAKCDEDCPVRLLDSQSGRRVSGLLRAGTIRSQGGGYRGGFPGCATEHDTFGDAGGASRFFATFEPFRYVPKASRAERNAGVADLPERPLHWSSGDKSPGTFQSEGTRKCASNHHPTVKPVALMRWLVRLVTPPGGVVLDPFCGSGTTGVAAVHEGMRFIGIEQERDFDRIARRRMRHAISRSSAETKAQDS